MPRPGALSHQKDKVLSNFQNDPFALTILINLLRAEMQRLMLFISCKSDHHRLNSGCLKSLESTDMSCSM